MGFGSSESCCLALVFDLLDRRDDNFSFLWDFDLEDASAKEATTKVVIRANNAENFILSC